MYEPSVAAVVRGDAFFFLLVKVVDGQNLVFIFIFTLELVWWTFFSRSYSTTCHTWTNKIVIRTRPKNPLFSRQFKVFERITAVEIESILWKSLCRKVNLFSKFVDPSSWGTDLFGHNKWEAESRMYSGKWKLSMRDITFNLKCFWFGLSFESSNPSPCFVTKRVMLKYVADVLLQYTWFNVLQLCYCSTCVES